MSGVFRFESGRPFNIVMANDLGDLLFNRQKRPNRVSGVEAVIANGDFNPNTISRRLPGRIPVHSSWADGPARRFGARFPELQRRSEHLQSVP